MKPRCCTQYRVCVCRRSWPRSGSGASTARRAVHRQRCAPVAAAVRSESWRHADRSPLHAVRRRPDPRVDPGRHVLTRHHRPHRSRLAHPPRAWVDCQRDSGRLRRGRGTRRCSTDLCVGAASPPRVVPAGHLDSPALLGLPPPCRQARHPQLPPPWPGATGARAGRQRAPRARVCGMLSGAGRSHRRHRLVAEHAAGDAGGRRGLASRLPADSGTCTRRTGSA